MKKILIILGIVAVAGFLLLLVVIFSAVTVIRRAEGPAIYSGVGAWTRIDEFAHAQGKTNYIAFADSQLALLQEAQKQWQKVASIQDLSRLQKIQTNAYATTDRNIKNGQNPLAYLDETNAVTATFTASPATPASTNK